MDTPIKRNIALHILYTVALAAMAFWAGNFWSNFQYQNQNGATNFELHSSGDSAKFPLTSPLLECGASYNVSTKDTKKLKSDIQNIITQNINHGNIINASVYFRDLNNGPWIGINENEMFNPGSLLKVPFMIALFKQAEINPKVLNEKIYYSGHLDDTEQYYKPKYALTPGSSYTNEELNRAMVADSNNDAAILLGKSIYLNDFEKSYTDLGIDQPVFSKDYFISVRNYSSFLRILYNSTYLNRAFSEKALELLSQSTFVDGLRASIPANVAVAHKFGERWDDQGNIRQLHDCGIIYEPGRPYLLCIMTRGDQNDDFARLASVIKQISKITYTAVQQGGGDGKSSF